MNADRSRCDEMAMEAPTTDGVIQVDNAPPGYETMTSVSQDQLIQELQSQKGIHGFWSYMKAAGILFVGSVGCLVMAVVCVALPPAMIIMGTLYLERCPAQPYIPIYLIVEGVLAMKSAILATIVRIRTADGNCSPIQKLDKALMGIANLIHCFTIAWFIAGCTWVYGIYEPSFDAALTLSYCDPAIYLFAFWILNGVFILIGLLLFIGLLMVVISLIQSN